jgi:hypothetical protein
LYLFVDFEQLGSKSQRLLPVGEMKMFSHFVDERSGFDAREIENSEGIDLVVK